MKRKFTAQEVEELVSKAIHDEYGEIGMWTRCILSIVLVDGKYFRLEWEEGEQHEGHFYDQEAPEMIEIEETITVKKWVEKDN